MGNETAQAKVTFIKKIDEDERIVFGEVYAPNRIDTHGHMMEAKEIKEMAHKFMENLNLSRSIDTQHDNIPNGSYPIQSYIVDTDTHPLFAKDSWVLGVKVPEDDIWEQVKNGTINGYSMEILAHFVPAVATIEVFPAAVGKTEKSKTRYLPEHSHLYFLEFDEDGVVKKGRTSTEMNHSHLISYGTATEAEQYHSHRFV